MRSAGTRHAGVIVPVADTGLVAAVAALPRAQCHRGLLLCLVVVLADCTACGCCGRIRVCCWRREGEVFALAGRQAAIPACLRPADVRATASRARALHCLDRAGGLEHENLDRHVGVDVVLTHECDDLAVELSFDDFYEVVTHYELVVVPESDDPIRAAEVD